MLRVLCQQVCIALRLPDGFLPKDASFDPLYVTNWFQNLVRLFESLNQTLVIFVDDLHLMDAAAAALDFDATVAALSWMPLSLPDNVHLICTTAVGPERLRLTLVQRERLRRADSYVELPPGPYLKQHVCERLDELEAEFGRPAVARLGALLSAAQYGLTETEYLELLMPTSSSTAVIRLEDGNFNFSSLCSVRRRMGTY